MPEERDIQGAIERLPPWPPLPSTTEELDGRQSPFPLSALPAWLQTSVEMTARWAQVPTAFPAVLYLAAVSALASGTAWVQPRSEDDEWIEGTNLYLVLVAAPGARKTPVFKLARQPLLEHEAELQKKTSGPDGTPGRLMIGDATPEAIASLLADHHALALFDDEGTVFATLAGRYSSGVPNLDVVLKAFSNSPVTVDRIGRGRTQVERPALCMGLAVQPRVLSEAMANSAFVGRGLLDRMMVAQPDTASVLRSARAARAVAESPDWTAAKEAWLGRMRDLGRALRAVDGDLVLSLDAAGKDLLDDFQDELDDRRLSGDLQEPWDGWAGKLHGITLRLAACLHLAGEAQADRTVLTSTIPAAAFEQAASITQWFIAERKVVGADIVTGGIDERRYQIAKHTVLHSDRSWITAREIYANRRATFPLAKDLDPALERLVDEGILRPIELVDPVSGNRKPGRQARIFAIHPSFNHRAMQRLADSW